ncbi:hypothetical protein P170DRAFT_479598 [Aspergillus steynii IBT 23096]|uniref:Uncharacterized protein n=1 Tax=Aspergillus steynii IBT 23096 TaxID=1392250 RepID=A0A2I2FWR9_9EURO|nr:uncharacterized protein P170DRAFT_479598 [Aspergillus steynii IBT 23096]PLB45068.1 hypothetical protein P170DRAFT_479598 [Aspergillus steynii IBT 23096]
MPPPSLLPAQPRAIVTTAQRYKRWLSYNSATRSQMPTHTEQPHQHLTARGQPRKEVALPSQESPSGAAQYALTTLDQIVNWARQSSLYPMTFGLACCAF